MSEPLKIEYKGGRFVAFIRYEDRHVYKRGGWEWSRVLRKWTTGDIHKVLPYVEKCVGEAKSIVKEYLEYQDNQIRKSLQTDSDLDIPSPEGLEYLPFQRGGIEYAAGKNSVLIGDAPGLGKTIQAIGTHNYIGSTNVLVICPASLKENWRREFTKWDVHKRTVGIAETRPARAAEKKETGKTTMAIWPDTDVVIINYDILETFEHEIHARTWDLLVCDESHKLKEKKAIRTKFILGGQSKTVKKNGKVIKRGRRYKKIPTRKTLFLSGTPVMSKPIEIWTMAEHCDPTGLGRDWEEFVFRYCDGFYTPMGLDSTGASNLDELQSRLRSAFMVRREKTEVLTELPDKNRQIMTIPYDKLVKVVAKEKDRVSKALHEYEKALGITEERDFMFILDEICSKIDFDADTLEDQIAGLTPYVEAAFVELSAAREEASLAKTKAVADFVKELLDNGEPVVLFAYHKSVVNEYKKYFPDAAVITGDVPVKKRQEEIDRYMSGDTDIIIGNITAMGVGFTLTRGYTVVFGELAWVPAEVEQAEDRVWRHGQKNAVQVYYCVVDGSIDSYMAQRMLEKSKIVKETMDA